MEEEKKGSGVDLDSEEPDDGLPKTEITVTLRDGRRLRVAPDKYDEVKTEVEGMRSLVSGLGVVTVLLLIGITVYIQYNLGGGWRLQSHDRLVEWGLSIESLRSGWSALFTHLFVHADWVHLISNMLFLLFFGIGLGKRQGPLIFLAVYFLGGAVGGIFGMVASLANDGTTLMGASGAVYAVLGASALVAPGGDERNGGTRRHRTQSVIKRRTRLCRDCWSKAFPAIPHRFAKVHPFGCNCRKRKQGNPKLCSGLCDCGKRDSVYRNRRESRRVREDARRQG